MKQLKVLHALFAALCGSVVVTASVVFAIPDDCRLSTNSVLAALIFIAAPTAFSAYFLWRGFVGGVTVRAGSSALRAATAGALTPPLTIAVALVLHGIAVTTNGQDVSFAVVEGWFREVLPVMVRELVIPIARAAWWTVPLTTLSFVGVERATRRTA